MCIYLKETPTKWRSYSQFLGVLVKVEWVLCELCLFLRIVENWRVARFWLLWHVMSCDKTSSHFAECFFLWHSPAFSVKKHFSSETFEHLQLKRAKVGSIFWILLTMIVWGLVWISLLILLHLDSKSTVSETFAWSAIAEKPMLWRAFQSISRTRKIRRPGTRRALFCWKPLSGRFGNVRPWWEVSQQKTPCWCWMNFAHLFLPFYKLNFWGKALQSELSLTLKYIETWNWAAWNNARIGKIEAQSSMFSGDGSIEVEGIRKLIATHVLT